VAIAAIAAVGVTAAPLADGASLQASTTSRSGETRQQTMRRVVRAWSRLLNAGDNPGVARLFRLPAVFVQGGLAYKLKTAEQVAMWHEGLPCAGRVTSIRIAGRFATAVFVLGDRKGSKCDAPPGEKAAAKFGIVRGKIVSWEQVAVPDEAPPGPVA
jgi:hypothetical protein